MKFIVYFLMDAKVDTIYELHILIIVDTETKFGIKKVYF